MDCKATEQRLAAWADNELSLQERHSFQQHVDQCPACAFLVAEFATIWSSQQNQNQEQTVGEVFLESVMERLQAPAKPWIRFERLFKQLRYALQPIAAAAIIAVAVGVGWYIGGVTEQGDSTSQDAFYTTYTSVLGDAASGSFSEYLLQEQYQNVSYEQGQ
ncbi:MAG: zf-HC2 domain-containing protein [Chitinivibrionales bacterium]|nr:zf-HC2 domain-containing protein [Chitinivibrionales bacterium]